jgi:hypothetical protein
MAEATGTTSVGTQEAGTAAQVASEPAKFIVGSDGAFVENWKQSLPEDIRAEKSLDTFHDLPGAMKMFVNAQRKLGMKGVTVPTEKSTDEDWGEFYKAVGRPEKPEEYKLAVPKGLEAVYNENVLKDARGVIHAAGLTQRQADTLMAWDSKRTAAFIEARAKARQDGLAALRKSWGDDWKKNEALVQKVVADHLPPESIDEMKELMDDHPVLAQLLAKVGGNFMEDHLADEGQSVGVATAQAEIERLRATPGYANGELSRTNKAEFDAITERLSKLYEKAYPKK